MNGGFGLVLDGSGAAGDRAESMLNWDVANGLADAHGHGIRVPSSLSSELWTKTTGCG